MRLAGRTDAAGRSDDAAYEQARKDADNGAAKADNLKQKAIDLRDSAKPVELGNTYTTRYERVAHVTYPPFAFDYPSNWTISDPEIDSFREIVTLTNERGVVIRYAQLDRGSVSGDGTWRMDIEKVADSSFIPDYVQATDLRGLGTFMVASAVCTGSLSGDGSYTDIANSPMNYTILPESRVGVAEGLRGDNSSALSFNYAASLSFATVDVQGGLTPRETREVIAILSSFRTA